MCNPKRWHTKSALTHIVLNSLCNVDPLTPHFLIVKLVFTLKLRSHSAGSVIRGKPRPCHYGDIPAAMMTPVLGRYSHGGATVMNGGAPFRTGGDTVLHGTNRLSPG